jgi:putative cell wall-binding protein
MRLHPAQVFMVGFASGTPLEGQVETVLAQASVTLVAGQDRYMTAALVAKQVKAKLGTIAKVVVAPGDSFAPALAVGALAAAQGWPILLVPTRGDVPPATIQAFASLGATSALEVGTSSRLPIADVEHEQGADAYQTAVLLAQYGLKHGLSFTHTALATGESFPDALCVGPYLAKDKGMLLLTNNEEVPPATAGLLTAQSTHIHTLDVIGLPGLAKELGG